MRFLDSSARAQRAIHITNQLYHFYGTLGQDLRRDLVAMAQ